MTKFNRDQGLNKVKKEIISIPAGRSYPLIFKYLIHSCPDDRGHSYKHMPYYAFRNSGGVIEMLFKVESIQYANPYDPGSVAKVDLKYRDRIARYIAVRAKKFSFSKKQRYKFYILSKEGQLKVNPSFVLANAQNQRYHTREEILGRTEMDFRGAVAIPEEILSTEVFTEGAVNQILVNRYERDPEARQACIERYGARCFVCEFDFEKTYGDLGKGFIHVHHLKPLSKIGKAYQINPVEDLRPVCPNCHAMIHRKNEALSIEELKKIIKQVQLR